MKVKELKRNDGRKADEPREMKAAIGVIKRADGSAMFQIGKTVAYAAVYGPRELHPRFLQNPEKGLLRCNYNMLAFSGSGERVRPGPSRRSKELSLVIQRSLSPMLYLEQYPNSVIDVFIELLQTDSGTRCAGICAASLALAHAGIPMRDMVASIAVGLVEGNPVVDLTKEEEDKEGAVDIAMAATSVDKKITLLQLDGVISKDQLTQCIAMGKKACEKIFALQKKTLQEHYRI